jgi:KRAB domain-containing zinc finger protein
MTFDRQNTLTIHNKSHLKPYIRECKLCDKKFKTLKGLRFHEILHGKEAKFKCEKCGKQFDCLSTFEVHLLRHGNIRNFKCRFCELDFKTNGDLKRHELNRHELQKRFKCETCGKGYNRTDAYQDHMKKKNCLKRLNKMKKKLQVQTNQINKKTGQTGQSTKEPSNK